MSTNPFGTDKRTVESVVQQFSLTAGTVTSVPSSDGSGITGIVKVTLVGTEEPTTATLAPPTSGSADPPAEGERVLLVRRPRGDPVVLGAMPTTNNPLPAYDSGDRVVGHAASGATVTFQKDGTVEIDGATDVVVNGGTTNPVIDVSTTKDADGHVTDVSLTRATDVYL